MNAMPHAQDVAAFSTLVAEAFGFQLDERHRDHLAEVLARRLAETGYQAQAYLARLCGAWPSETEALASELTVGETYFFRSHEQFQALVELALPERIAARRGEKRLEILSAGCASGEEAYTVAILLRERFGELADWDVRITAIDVNPAALERAAKGLYSAWSLRSTPAEIQARYFRPSKQGAALDPAIRAMVHFEPRNLIQADAGFWRAGRFDVIFCRNVLIYFSPAATRLLADRFEQALTPGGYLFLGAAESLRGISQGFRLCHTHETFYYQRKGAEKPAPAPVPTPKPAALTLSPDTSWVDAIGQAADRIGRLDARGRASAARAPQTLALALDFFREERFAEAHELLKALTPDAMRDPDAMLLLAAVLTNSGQLEEAERVLGEILQRDELSPGAHYLLALCREHAGDREAAAKQDEMAAYLDANFAMPHLHLGLMAKRDGEYEIARRELAAAHALLADEDPARILLFGGGFNRAALEALCRSELKQLEGKP